MTVDLTPLQQTEYPKLNFWYEKDWNIFYQVASKRVDPPAQEFEGASQRVDIAMQYIID